MNNLYTDTYYDHFSGHKTLEPPQFQKNRNYMMRFRTPMTNYTYDDNDLTVIFFEKGHGDLVWKNKKNSLHSDDFIVTNPGRGWEYINETNHYIDVLSLVICEKFRKEFNFYSKSTAAKLLDNPFDQIDMDTFFIEKPLSAKHYPSGRLLRQIHKCSQGEHFQFFSAEELSIQITKALYRDQVSAYIFANKIEAKKYSTKVETLKRLLVAREYILNNISKKVSLTELSQISSLSKFHLYESFRRVFGKTPHQYTNCVKIVKARSLLLNSNLSVSEISALLGFNDLAAFSKLFKKAYGHSPTKYLSLYYKP